MLSSIFYQTVTLPVNIRLEKISGKLKGMSDEWQNRPILSGDKIARQ